MNAEILPSERAGHEDRSGRSDNVDTTTAVNGRTSWSLLTGRILIRALRHQPAQKYLLYLPSATLPAAPVVVSKDQDGGRNATVEGERGGGGGGCDPP